MKSNIMKQIIMLLENERRAESHEHVGEKKFDNM